MKHTFDALVERTERKRRAEESTRAAYENASERNLRGFRAAQRRENQASWIAYYGDRISKAMAEVEYYRRKLWYVESLAPHGDPPRGNGRIVTHAAIDAGSVRASLEDLPEDSKNGHG